MWLLNFHLEFLVDPTVFFFFFCFSVLIICLSWLSGDVRIAYSKIIHCAVKKQNKKCVYWLEDCGNPCVCN